MPEAAPGVRRFGKAWNGKPPTAQPPTLTLYLGHGAIDLETLSVPSNVDLVAPDGTLCGSVQDDARIIDPFVGTREPKQIENEDGDH